MLPFFAWKIFSISFFISLDFYLQVLLAEYDKTVEYGWHCHFILYRTPIFVFVECQTAFNLLNFVFIICCFLSRLLLLRLRILRKSTALS